MLVLNELRGGDFSILEESGVLERAATLGSQVVPLRRLHDAAMRKIDATSASLWAATRTDAAAVGELGLMDRQRVRVWLKGASQALDAVGAEGRPA